MKPLLAHALAAIRTRRSLDDVDGWLPAAPFAHLRSAAEQYERAARLRDRIRELRPADAAGGLP